MVLSGYTRKIFRAAEQCTALDDVAFNGLSEYPGGYNFDWSIYWKGRDGRVHDAVHDHKSPKPLKTAVWALVFKRG